MLPIHMEEDNLDFIMASAQKGLMAMTGLSFVIGRTEILEASRHYPHPEPITPTCTCNMPS